MAVTTQIESLRTPSVLFTRLKLQRHWLALSVLLLCIAASNLYFLLDTPSAFVDEGWNANRAWAMLQTGRAFGSLDAGVLDKFAGYWTFFPWLGTLLQALPMAVFGPTLFAIRLASLLFGMVLLLEIFLIAKRLYDERTGFLAVLSLALSYPFIYSSHMGRHDIILAAFGFGAICLYLHDASSGWPVRSIFAGILVGLTLDIHLNGVLYIPVIACLLLLDERLSIWRSRRAWGLAAGFILGAAFFVSMHLLLYPQTYESIAALGGNLRTPPVLSGDPTLWLASAEGTLVLIGVLRLPIVAGAAILMLYRRSKSDIRMLVLFAATFLAFAGAVQYKSLQYAIITAPVIDVMVATFLNKVIEKQRKRTILNAMLLSVSFGLIGAFALVNPIQTPAGAKQEYESVLSKIKSAVTPGSRLMGTQTYWFGLPDQSYYSWEQLVYYRRYAPGSTLMDAFKALHPDFFLMDGHLDGFVADNGSKQPHYFEALTLPKSALETFLGIHGQLVTQIPTQQFGNIRIYKIDWSKSSWYEVPSPTLGQPN